ncbi:hypothetical protein B0H14DRAFT_3907120 [Mycena olivaceomarginata]|nr:hypothetical protein B0H14DRAFT_3907120 [Mycena olivaceomarginata]
MCRDQVLSRLHDLAPDAQYRHGAALPHPYRHRSLATYGDFSITDNEKPDLKLSPTIVKAITSIFSQLSNLRFLELLIDEAIEFTDMLQHAYFPNLTSFKYTIEPQTSALLPLFLNRHPTLDDLTLAQRHPIERLDPVHLPNLKCYGGPACFVPSLTLDRGCISWDDIALAPSSLSSRAMSSRSQRSSAVWAIHLSLVFAETLEIAAHLKKLSCLSTLDFFGDDDYGPVEHDTAADCETIKLWGKACKSLHSIVLNGAMWKRVAWSLGPEIS